MVVQQRKGPRPGPGGSGGPAPGAGRAPHGAPGPARRLRLAAGVGVLLVPFLFGYYYFRPRRDRGGEAPGGHVSGGFGKTVEGSSWTTVELGPLVDTLPPDLSGITKDQMTLPGAEVEPRMVSASPRIYVFDELLTPEECEYLIRLADGRLKPAGVVLQTAEKYALQTMSRNNEQVWLTQKDEKVLPMLRHIIKRIHRVGHIPDTDAEGLQIGRYTLEQKYEPHVDTDPAHDVTRPATLLAYLSDVESGGDTIFPLNEAAKCRGWQRTKIGEQRFGCANCCDEEQSGMIRIRPKRGRAVLFFNHEPSGVVDRLTEHAACPVRAGVKWIAQRWFRLKPYQSVKYPPDPRFDGLPFVEPTVGIPEKTWSGRVRVLSDRNPRVFLLEMLFSASECQHLMHLGEANLADDSNSTGFGKWTLPFDSERTDLIASGALNRLHRAAYMPEPHGDALRLLRLTSATSEDGKLKPIKKGWHAVAWVFLEQTHTGGHLVVARAGDCRRLADCCEQHSGKALRIPVRAGRAVLIYPDEAGDTRHVFCPLRNGSMWVAMRVFQVRPKRGTSGKPTTGTVV